MKFELLLKHKTMITVIFRVEKSEIETRFSKNSGGKSWL